MTAAIIQAQYDQLEEISKRFTALSDSSDEMRQNVYRHLGDLQNGGWLGEGSEAFFAEMNDDVLPAYQRLTEAFGESSLVVMQIIEILQTAEEEAANRFDVGKGATASNTVGPGVEKRNVSSRYGEETIGTRPIDEHFWRDDIGIQFPTSFKALLELIGESGGTKLKGFLAVVGTIFDAYRNEDNDLLQSATSAGAENLIPFAHPVLAKAFLVNALVQLGGQVVETLDDWQLEILPVSSDLKQAINQASNDFYHNVDRADLGKITGPLADIYYDFSFTPGLEAQKDFAANPSLINQLRMGLIQFSGPPVIGNPAVGLLVSPEARQGVYKGIGQLIDGVGGFGSGVSELPRSFIVRSSAINAGYVAAGINLVVPQHWEPSVNNAASLFIMKLNDALDFN